MKEIEKIKRKEKGKEDRNKIRKNEESGRK